MRLEAKHREASQYMHGVSSRKNVALTIAIKAQLRMSNGYLLNEDEKKRFCIGSGSSDQLCNDSLFEDFLYILKENMSSDIVFVAKFLSIYNKRYCCDDIIQILNEPNDNVLYQIYIIFQLNDLFFLICKELEANLCNGLFYTVEPTKFFKLIDFKKHKISSPCVLNTFSNEKLVVRIKEF